jgi:hypothetical protein
MAALAERGTLVHSLALFLSFATAADHAAGVLTLTGRLEAAIVLTDEGATIAMIHAILRAFQSGVYLELING